MLQLDRNHYCYLKTYIQQFRRLHIPQLMLSRLRIEFELCWNSYNSGILLHFPEYRWLSNRSHIGWCWNCNYLVSRWRNSRFFWYSKSRISTAAVCSNQLAEFSRKHFYRIIKLLRQFILSENIISYYISQYKLSSNSKLDIKTK